MSYLIDTFTWPLVGGALIGLSAALLMLFNGRLARFSPRSIVSVITFIAAGAVSTFLAQHVF